MTNPTKILTLAGDINPDRRTASLLAFALMLVFADGQISADDKKDKIDTNSKVVLDVVRLKKSDVGESSGLAASNVHANRWWTHNDSGDKARLYAVDQQGKSTGRCQLKNIKAKDWEDMASFVQDGQPRLIVADCGDNLGKRKSITLHLLDEPDPNKKTGLDRVQSIKIAFPDHAHDCEAIAVNADQKQILLITKSKLPHAIVFQVELPDRLSRPSADNDPLVAQRVTSLTVPLVSGFDIDQNNGDIWIVNYFHAIHYKRARPDQTLTQQLTALPRILRLPRWKQIEAVAVDDNHQVWITSEGRSPPLGRLNLSPNKTHRQSPDHE